jgi:hypothetical protein
MPIASVPITTSVKSGLRRSVRTKYERSWQVIQTFEIGRSLLNMKLNLFTAFGFKGFSATEPAQHGPQTRKEHFTPLSAVQ